MRGLTRTDHRERGAVAIIVALVAVILFGIAAWVIDGSALRQERRELQNGADAAALAIAQDCAVGDCDNAAATAQPYLDQNATSDSRTALQPNGITYPTGNQVRVAVQTFDAAPGGGSDGDADTVDFVFAPVLGQDGSPVTAEATAQWSAAGGGGAIPIIISDCEWRDATANGSNYASPPFDGLGQTIHFLDPSGNNGNGNGDDDGDGDGDASDVVGSCDYRPGHDAFDGSEPLPGGFGWLESSDCEAEVLLDEWIGANPGNGPPSDCDLDSLLGTTVMIPVFDDFAPDGGPPGCGPGGKCYHVLGYAAFHLTGYRFPGRQSSPPPCGPPLTCISGHMTQFVFGPATGGGGTDLGAKAIWLVG